ncbi:hypothetical protein HZB88_01110 [archaeon]|nr:hypothetical protein [archaeon]
MIKARRKGTALLIIVGFAFIASIILFYNLLHLGIEKDKIYYAGDSAIDVYRAYEKGGEMMLFLEASARFSYEKMKGETGASSNMDMEQFKKYFEEYLVQFNAVYNQEIQIEDYEFTITEGKIEAKTSKRLAGMKWRSAEGLAS